MSDPAETSPEDRLRAALVVMRLGAKPDLPLMETLRALASVAGALVDAHPTLLLTLETTHDGRITLEYKMDGLLSSTVQGRNKPTG